MGNGLFSAPGRADASMIGWATAARLALASGPTALVSVLAIEGSAPLGAGARMVVTAEGIRAGSVGGGALEWQALRQALAILALKEGSWRVQDYPLGPLLGQCCGGRVRLLVERLDPVHAGWLDDVAHGAVLACRFTEGGLIRSLAPGAAASPLSARDPRPDVGFAMVERFGVVPRAVLVFGAGHVGMALARVLEPLPFALHWFDSRAEFATSGVTLASEEALLAALAQADQTAAVLVMTHDHGLDFTLAKAALARDFALVGVIGSATKRARFLSRLAREGVDEATRARLVCPIGMPGIKGKDPAVIAIAVAAQLLALPRGDNPC